MSKVSNNENRVAAGNLILRADASTTIGTGHVMRCLALAEAWNARGGQSTLISSCDNAFLQERTRAASVHLVELPCAVSRADDIAQTCSVACVHGVAPVVLDGYEFDSDYQRAIKSEGLSLAVLDDFVHADHYVADLVINQNLDAEKLTYSREPYTRLLLGAQYIILRGEFKVWRNWSRSWPQKARRILVTLGGSDSANVTLRVIQAFDAVPDEDVEVLVVVGSSNPNRVELASGAAAARVGVRLEFDVTGMAERMAWADLAVAAGGATCWELAFMGLPSAIIILADNQRRGAEALAAHGAISLVGESECITPEDIASVVAELMDDGSRRERMSTVGRSLVDGLGAERVVDAIMELARGSESGD
ncbi:MAG: UDP-2,4-diacetamido-2,4,6-trideoxy-beta-L-altropyranose hydrolase [Candidatus Hydrogenedentes bacterium]|nr:UDP-2,4-diacetamido-2,4,6-trideoxy-beta-L-altropyranose hydrolase [Candidatus Hydrogenedentota bacterium]